MSYRELTSPTHPGQPVRANPEANFYCKNSKQSWKTSAALGRFRGQETGSLAWLAYKVRSSGGRVGLVLTTLNISSEVPGFDPRHLQTAFKLTGVSECCSGHFVFG